MLIAKTRSLNILLVQVNYIRQKKNHKLLKELILDNSNENDIVFDPCSGSGSTLLCAKQLHRQYLGCELDKQFYDIAYNRLNTLTQLTIT